MLPIGRRQGQLFGPMPRKRRRVMMKLADFGQGAALFRCGKCELSGWVKVDESEPVWRLKKGRPCPRCNAV